jgi:hypothetical protein
VRIAGGTTGIGLLLALTSWAPVTFADTRYVQVIKDDTPILATRGGEVVGRVPRGTVLQLVGDRGGEYAVKLFSAETRYVRRSAARPVPYHPFAPDDATLRQQLQSALVAAEARARYEQPPRASQKLRALLLDRHKLAVMTGYNLNPPVEALLDEPVVPAPLIPVPLRAGQPLP